MTIKDTNFITSRNADEALQEEWTLWMERDRSVHTLLVFSKFTLSGQVFQYV